MQIFYKAKDLFYMTVSIIIISEEPQETVEQYSDLYERDIQTTPKPIPVSEVGHG